MEYYSRYQANQGYPKSEFTIVSPRDPNSSASSTSGPPPKKKRKDDQFRDEVRMKLKQGSANLRGCSGETDILHFIMENGVKIGFHCSVCKAIFSPNTGGYLKVHRAKCLKNIHLDKANPHEFTESERNELVKLIIDSMTKDGQAAVFFNTDNFVSMLQYVHDLGFQYGLENAQTTKGGNPYGAGDMSAVIPHHLELERIVEDTVNEKKIKFFELVKNSIGGIGGGFVIDRMSQKYDGFVLSFITNNWEYITAPVAVDLASFELQNKKWLKAFTILRNFNLSKDDVNFVFNQAESDFDIKDCQAPLVSASHWFEQKFDMFYASPPPVLSVPPKMQTTIKEIFQMTQDVQTLMEIIAKDADLFTSLSYNNELDFECRKMSKWFAVHKFVAFLPDEIATIQNYFSSKDDKQTCKDLTHLCRNKTKLEMFVRRFRPFLDAIQSFEIDNAPTLHLVIGTLFETRKKMETEIYANQLEKAFAEIILHALEDGTNGITSDPHFFAFILDPKQKNKLKDYLSKEEFLRVIKSFENVVSQVDEIQDKELQCSDFNPYETTILDSSNTYKTELSLYYRTNVSCDDEEYDILQWWKENAGQFPRLSKLARRYLSIPASCSSVDRIFGSSMDEKSFCTSVDQISNAILFQTIEKLGL